jgi:hypothetical protein
VTFAAAKKSGVDPVEELARTKISLRKISLRKIKVDIEELRADDQPGFQ